jgi:tRNA/tmRNA/rRNA uracil-C5-methylase (TrmA/RlmC/RlmD family)
MSENKIVRLNGDRLVNCPIDEYDNQLSIKVNKYKTLISNMYQGDIDIYESERSHYRMRANFNIWRDMPKNNNNKKGKKYNNCSNKNHDTNANATTDATAIATTTTNDTTATTTNDINPNVYYAMFDESRNACEITSFPRGTILMNELMTKLMIHIHNNNILQDKLFEVRFVTTLSNNAVIILLYRRPINIDNEWKNAATILSNMLNVKIVGRSRKVKIIASDNHKNDNNNDDDDDDSANDGEIIEEILNVNDKSIKYYQTEGGISSSS